MSGSEWFSLSLGDGLCALPLLDDLLADFAARPAVDGQALLLLRDTDGRLQCELTAYFTPAAASLARAWGARPCLRPSPDNLERLAGDAGWRARWFG